MRLVAKKILIPLLAIPCTAKASFSGFAEFSSDYIFRGISQNEGNAGFVVVSEYALNENIYLGLNANNLSISGAPEDMDPSVQNDLAIKYRTDINDNSRFFAEYYRYVFSSASDLDMNEFHLGATYKSAAFRYYFSDDFSSSGKKTHYFESSYDYEINDNLSIYAHVGYWDRNNAFGLSSYTNWTLVLNQKVKNVLLRYGYTGTTEIPEDEDNGDNRFFIALQLSI